MPIVRIPHDTAIEEPLQVSGEKLLAGDPRQGVSNLYSDPGAQFHSGIWEAEPATWRVNYTEHEFCHILQGRIRMTDDQGVVTEVAAGDSFVVPAGYRSTWQVLEKARKVYVIFEPQASGN